MWKSTKRPRPRDQDASYTHKSGLVWVRSESGFSCYRFVMLPAARQRHNTRITYARPAEGTSTQPCAVTISLSLSFSLSSAWCERKRENGEKAARRMPLRPPTRGLNKFQPDTWERFRFLRGGRGREWWASGGYGLERFNWWNRTNFVYSIESVYGYKDYDNGSFFWDWEVNKERRRKVRGKERKIF